jgi:hypothetical protein
MSVDESIAIEEYSDWLTSCLLRGFQYAGTSLTPTGFINTFKPLLHDGGPAAIVDATTSIEKQLESASLHSADIVHSISLVLIANAKNKAMAEKLESILNEKLMLTA